MTRWLPWPETVKGAAYGTCAPPSTVKYVAATPERPVSAAVSVTVWDVVAPAGVVVGLKAGGGRDRRAKVGAVREDGAAAADCPGAGAPAARPRSVCVVPEACADQPDPSAVTRMAPLEPATHPRDASGRVSAYRVCSAGGAWRPRAAAGRRRAQGAAAAGEPPVRAVDEGHRVERRLRVGGLAGPGGAGVDRAAHGALGADRPAGVAVDAGDAVERPSRAGGLGGPRRAAAGRVQDVPRPPTAQPLAASAKATPYSVCVVPDFWALQEAPPFVVRRIVPPPPTIQPWSASAKATPYSVCVVPDVCAVHFAPPLIVWRIVPPPPTAQPVVGVDEGDAVQRLRRARGLRDATVRRRRVPSQAR